MRVLFTLFFILSFLGGNGQDSYDHRLFKVSPLDSTLLKYTDSIYVFEVLTNSIINQQPVFYLTKKSSTVNLFEYSVDFINLKTLPAGLGPLFIQRKLEFERLNDNRKFDHFFKAKNLDTIESKTLWEKLASLKPTELIDDFRGGHGCDSIKIIYAGALTQPIEILHDLSLRLTLLTNNKVESFYFFAPNFYYEQCPIKRESRRKILATQQLFSKYASL